MKTFHPARGAILAAALAVLSPAAALAQSNTGATDTGYATTSHDREDGDGDDFPWGLLGLLGLAGLLGLKRKERDIHVDARRNP